MDALEQFLGGAAPSKPSAPAKKVGQPTAQEMYGIRDLQDSLTQVQSSLADYVPGSPSHKRALADIKSIQSELQRHGTATQPAAQSAPAAAQPTGDPLEAFLSGQPVAAAKPVEMTTGTAEGTMGAYVPRPTVGPVARTVAGLANKYLQAKQNLGEKVAGGIDTLYGIVPATYGAVIQGLARTAQTPEQAAQTGQAAATSVEKPVGKFLGITGKETYQQPLGGITQPIAEQINKMFNVLGMTPEQISEKTGVPAADIRNMVVIGSTAIPQAIKQVAPVVKQAGQAIAKPIQEAAAELQVVKPLSKAEAQAQFEARKAPEGSAGAAAATTNPFAGQITGEETVRGQFPQVKLTKIPEDVPVSEQQLRSQLFQEVLPDLKPRPGVVTGNDNLLRNEHGLANMAEPSPKGIKLKEQIANEQIGFSKYAQDRVNATGASTRLINDEQRGQTINDVIHGVSLNDEAPSSLMGYFKNSKKQIYDSAFERVGNNQIKTANTDTFFNNPQQLATAEKEGTLNFLNGAKKEIELAKTVGYELPDGKIAPANSVAALNAVIKSNNAAWSPEKANTIRKINAVIDRDIAAVADPSLYKLGDKIHRLEKEIFESRGIDKIFGEVDKNNVVTSATALEKIPSKLNNMPKDQWRHIRDTLNELANGRVRGAPEGMPPIPQELRQAATAAIAEIDGALAREVYKAGASKIGEWNSNSVNDVLNSTVGEKILETFPPSEVQKYHALNYVGQFTPGLKYEGAGQQMRRIGLLEKNYPAVGAAIGSGLGAIIGETPLSKEAALGGFIGREAGAYLQTKKAAREEAKAVKKMEVEMQKAAALGKQTGKNKLQDLGK